MGHENAEGIALGCVRVDLTVRLGSEGTALHLHVHIVLMIGA